MIENIYIADVEEPERVIEVGLVGDVAYLAIGSWNPEFEKRTFTAQEGSQIAVVAADILNAITVLSQSQAREDTVRELGTDRDLRLVQLS